MRSLTTSQWIICGLLLASAIASCQLSPNKGATPEATAILETAATPARAAGGLHNVHALNDRIISGAVPEGDAAFDELQAMGVNTIISVDGATPDVEAAARRGMRYVHVPITYAQVSPSQQLTIAKAIRDLPGPVYLHCHHGKHRGPAAVAVAGIRLGMISNDPAIAFMKTAGTAANYQGLYACAEDAVPFDRMTLDAAPGDFPAVHKAEGLTAAMVEIDLAFEHLGVIRAANWTTPPAHPDLIPAAEAGRLADNLRFGSEDIKAAILGDDFVIRLNDAIAIASALEEAIVRNAPADELEAAYQAMNASCTSCHASHRDNVSR